MSEETTTTTTSSNYSLRQWFMGRSSNSETFVQQPPPRILILDGGVSTHLEDMLRQPGAHRFVSNNNDDGSIASSSSSALLFPYRELWSSGLLLSQVGKEIVASGHDDWLEAGVNVISTTTYQCHYESSLWPSSPTDDDDDDGKPIITEEIMDQMWKDSIDLAKRAVLRKNDDFRPHYVVASSGCYGAALSNGAEYTGDYGDLNNDEATAIATICNFHRRKILAACASHPDGVAIETVPSLMECRAIRTLLCNDAKVKEELGSKNIVCYVSLSCRNGSELNDGTSLKSALEVLRDVPISYLQAIGLNCCDVRHVPQLLSILVTELMEHTPNRGIAIYPNSGEIWDATHQQWLSGTGVTTPHEMAATLMHCVTHIENLWRQHESNVGSSGSEHPFPSILIGGCCRTRPSTMAALRKLVDAHLS